MSGIVTPTKTSTTPAKCIINHTPPKNSASGSPPKYSVKPSPVKENCIKGSPVKNLNFNTSSEDLYSEGLITYLLSSPLAKFPWLKNVKDVKKIHSAFASLDKTDQRLYAKLFARQHAWIRLKRIKYKFVDDLPTSIDNLQLQGFVTTGICNDLPLSLCYHWHYFAVKDPFILQITPRKIYMLCSIF